MMQGFDRVIGATDGFRLPLVAKPVRNWEPAPFRRRALHDVSYAHLTFCLPGLLPRHRRWPLTASIIVG
jgi:hypothetical protein